MPTVTVLSIDQVKIIHQNQLDQNGGGSPGIRDEKLLESAVLAPIATLDQSLLYKTIFEMAGAYLVGLSRNHAFIDGNKRTAVACASTFLLMNGIGLSVDHDEMVEFVMDIVCKKLDVAVVATFLEERAVEVVLDTEQ